MERLVLIDGNAILHRAYHALPALTTRNGELVNAVYGFASMLLRILDELHPEYIAVSFDTAAPNFRHTEYVGYKANRPRMDSELAGQIERVHDLVRAFNIPILEVDGYEADDVIGSLARQASQSKRVKEQESKNKKKISTLPLSSSSTLEVIIVTGDKDLMQLVDENVKLYMPTKGLSEGQIVGKDEVLEKMGVGPEMIVDYKGLVGDPADNYPGVPGIGPKTAIELLKKFGSVEGIYHRLAEGSSFAKATADKQEKILTETTVRKLAEGAESAVLSKKLAGILTDAPVKLILEDCVAKDYDKEKVLGLFKELGFRSLAGRIGGGGEDKGKTGERGEKGRKDERQGSLF